jgi:hypothetical protein
MDPADLNLVLIGAAIGMDEFQCLQQGIPKRTPSYEQSQVTPSGEWWVISLRDSNGTVLGTYRLKQTKPNPA